MPKNLEAFKNITASIQSIVLSLAVVIGGIWSTYTFSALKSKEKAETDYKIQETERAKQASVGLEIVVDAKQEPIPSKQGYVISAFVKITNKGSKNMPLEFSESPLIVRKLDFDDDGDSAFSFSLEQKNLVAKSIVLRPGTTEAYPYFAKVPEKGLYMVLFSLRLDNDQLKIHRESGGPDGDDVFWPGTAYVVVK